MGEGVVAEIGGVLVKMADVGVENCASDGAHCTLVTSAITQTTQRIIFENRKIFSRGTLKKRLRRVKCSLIPKRRSGDNCCLRFCFIPYCPLP